MSRLRVPLANTRFRRRSCQQVYSACSWHNGSHAAETSAVKGFGMHVVVIGARGRLGIEITNTAARAGVEVTAVARAPSPHWRSEVHYHRHAPAQELRNAFHGADAIIVAAPVSGRTLNSVAIDAGCHVVDVTINGEQIDSVLQLQEHARAAGKTVIMAAGLAPGLTGLIGKAVQSRARADAAIDVCLTQSAKGTAGEYCTREMLDMLTLRGSSRWCHLLQHADGAPQRARAFALLTTESSRTRRRVRSVLHAL